MTQQLRAPSTSRLAAPTRRCAVAPRGAVRVRAATIVETAVAAGTFKTLVAAVTAAGLVDTLNSAGPFTVFAPTDEAFAKLPAGTVESLLKPENKAKLTDILLCVLLCCWARQRPGEGAGSVELPEPRKRPTPPDHPTSDANLSHSYHVLKGKNLSKHVVNAPSSEWATGSNARIPMPGAIHPETTSASASSAPPSLLFLGSPLFPSSPPSPDPQL